MRSATVGFIGARLKEAREARGLSMASLAEILGVTRQAVSLYEKEDQTPRPEVMDRIASVLNLPKHFFLLPPQETLSNTVFFRSLSATTKTDRIRAEHKLSWLKGIIAYLKDFIVFKEVNFPDFNIETPMALSDDEIEEIATRCRRYWNITDNPISSIVMLLENNGAITTRCPLDCETQDAFSEWSLPDNSPYILLGSDKQSAVRSRFDASHELGHLVLHRHLSRSSFMNLIEHRHYEQQANRFAAAFLLPAKSFSRDVLAPNLEVFRILKEKWKVSMAMMIERCWSLKMIDDEHRTRLWKSYRRKYGSTEPLDDTLPPETPKFLRRSIELLVEKVQSKEDILSAIPFSASDIEDLTCLPKGYLTNQCCTIEMLPRLKKSRSKEGVAASGKVLNFPGVK